MEAPRIEDIDIQMHQNVIASFDKNLNVIVRYKIFSLNFVFHAEIIKEFSLIVMKRLQTDIQQIAGNKTRIREAYAAYKSANGPLYGDDGASETEISFPD